MIKPGDKVWYYYNGYNRFQKIKKITFTADGAFVIFEDVDCVNKTYKIPIEEVFIDKKEYFKHKNNLTKE